MGLLMRTGWQLAAVFAAIAVAVVGLAQVPAVRPMLFGLEGVLLVAALAILGAAAVLQPLLMRIESLGTAVDIVGDTTAAPLRLPGASAQGDALARLAARLEALSAQATAQAQALAAAQRERSTLVARLSHDLRTPLASIQGYLELLLLRQDAQHSAEARHHLQAAVAQCERLARRIGDLVELSRLEGEGAQAQTEPFALAELAHDVVQKFAPAARRRRVALDARCSDAAMVEADLALVARVLDGLVDNALRHTPAGGTVTVEVGAQAQRLRVAVCDSGEGIAADRLSVVLESPGGGDGAAAVSGHGADPDDGAGGLGLAIAQRIVALHGSRLEIDSRPGAGTRVAFELDRARPRRRTPDPETRS